MRTQHQHNPQSVHHQHSHQQHPNNTINTHHANSPHGVFNSRSCVRRTFDAPGGRAAAGRLALANARDLVPILKWNEAHGIRFFRLSSDILPWATFYDVEDLDDWPAIKEVRTCARAA